MDTIFNKLHKAKKVNKVIDVIREIQKEYDIEWVPVGGRENNLPTINMNSDPASSLVERITNAIDSIFERKWFELGKPNEIKSPREAAEKWFNIKEGTLSNHEKTSDYRSLSEKVEVTLFDSGDFEQSQSSRPTIDIRDNGCGIKPKDFKRSIVSLNESLKMNKHFLAGAFGQGGSTTFSFSEFTIIFSKRMIEDGNDSPVAATIVRFNTGAEDDKHGKYEYMINSETKEPLVFNISDNEFPVGTLVRHIAMEIGKFDSVLTSQTQGLYYLTHHYMFDPVYPFQIRDERDNSTKGEMRTVAGNNRRLTYGKKTEYQNDVWLTFRNGKVQVKWWVLTSEGKNSKNRIKNYTWASKPIVIAFNGQKQGEMSNKLIKSDLSLPYLEKYLIVYVNCDELDSTSRKQLFSTTRESLRDTPLLEELRQLVIDVLDGDDKLKILNKERKNKYIQNESSSLDSVKQRLKNRVSQVIRDEGDSGETTGGGTTNSGGGKTEEREPIPIKEPPTFLEIVGDETRKVYPGRRFILKFKTDAHPSYFVPDSYLSIVNPEKFGRYTGTTNIKDGYGTAYFEVDENINIGEIAEVTLVILIDENTKIKDSILVETAEPPKKGGKGNRVNLPNINPQWITKEDEFWEENSWDEKTVAEVIEDENSITVFVSEDNNNLNKIIKKAKNKSSDVTKQISNFYLENICFHAVLTSLQNKELEELNSSNEEILFDKEMKRTSETICGIINELFDLFVIESGS
jgi:hypothetical protein